MDSSNAGIGVTGETAGDSASTSSKFSTPECVERRGIGGVCGRSWSLPGCAKTFTGIADSGHWSTSSALRCRGPVAASVGRGSDKLLELVATASLLSKGASSICLCIRASAAARAVLVSSSATRRLSELVWSCWIDGSGGREDNSGWVEPKEVPVCLADAASSLVDSFAVGRLTDRSDAVVCDAGRRVESVEFLLLDDLEPVLCLEVPLWWSEDGLSLCVVELIVESTGASCLGLLETTEPASLLFFHASRPLSWATFGMPSHFELTLGTVAGSLCCETVATEDDFVPLTAASLRCCSANSLSATAEGSLTERKSKMERGRRLFSREMLGVTLMTSSLRVV